MRKISDLYHLLRLPDTPMLYMAGIYTVYEQEGMELPAMLSSGNVPDWRPVWYNM